MTVISPPLATKRVVPLLILFTVAGLESLWAQMPPPNDKCMNQIPVGEGIIIFCTDFATTTDYFVGSGKFSGFNFYAIKNDVFYCYTATVTGTIKIAVSGFPGVAVALASSCDCSTASPESLFDSCSTSNSTGSVSTNVVPGQQILIRVGSCDGSSGMVTLDIGCVPEKKNTRCATPDFLLPGATAFDFANTTLDGPDPFGNLGATLWYTYTPTCNEAVTFSVCSAPTDAHVAVYDFQSNCPTLAQALGSSPGACSSAGTALVANLIAGQTYLVQVGAPLGTSPAGILDVSAQPLLPPPANDDCLNALPIGNGVTAFTTQCATPSFVMGNVACDFAGDDEVRNDVWFEYTALCSETVFLDLSGSAYDTRVAVHTSCDPSLPPIACNDDANNAVTSRLRFQTAVGQSYLIRVGGYLGFTGVGELTVSCETDAPPPNDDVSNPLPIADGLLAFSNQKSTTDGPEDCECDVKKDVWYRYVATDACQLTVSLCGSTFDTYLALYPEPANPGIVLVPGDELDCVDDSCSFQSEVSAAVAAGEAVLLRVGGWNDTEGTGEILVQCQPLAPSFIRGRCNPDAAFDISDAIFLVNYLFQGAAGPTCESACDANDDGLLNIADIVALLSGLFAQPPLPLPPPQTCGPDPTPTAGGVDCMNFPGC
ncbi:MAG: hypothetical protein AB7O52_03800 [Planctomycetota bacterium]